MGKKSFAVELKSSRNALGLSQEKFAKKLGVSALSVCQWENGKYEPKEATMAKVKATLAKLGTAKPAAPVKVPKAKAPVKKATKVKAPAKTKAQVLRVADVLAVITEIRNSVRDLDQKFDTLKTPTAPITTSIVDVEPLAESVEVPEVKAILSKLIFDIKKSKKDGTVRGITRHVVEWPDICDTYYEALKILGIDE